MRRVRVMSVAVAAVMAVVGLGACEPPPPRVQLTVNSTEFGVDDNPGDGICRAPWANYRCTFRAAIQEANALGVADITLPAGIVYGPTPDPMAISVTGDVSITGAGILAATGTNLSPYTITVQAGARLRMTDLSSFNFNRVHLVVAGRLELHRVSFGGGFDTAFTVQAGGSAVVTDSALRISTSSSTVDVAGTMLLARSYLNTPQLRILDGGTMVTAGSVVEVDACAPAPVSLGHNRYEHPSCAADVTDTVGVPAADLETWRDPNNGFIGVMWPRSASSLVDAVPIGVAGCSTSLVDLFGNPRGGDGNGDGIPGCDVGAIERQSAPPA